jgi:hypothetical protein
MEKRKREESEEEPAAKRQNPHCSPPCGYSISDEQNDLDLLTDDDENEEEEQHLDLVAQVKQRHVRLQHTSYILSRMQSAIAQEEMYLTTAAHTDDEMRGLLASPFATHLKRFLPATDK